MERAVIPRGVEARAEEGIIFRVSEPLHGQIDIQDGVFLQGIFDTYSLVPMYEAPTIDVAIIESGAQLADMANWQFQRSLRRPATQLCSDWTAYPQVADFGPAERLWVISGACSASSKRGVGFEHRGARASQRTDHMSVY
jgi:hypothetical protein